MARWLFYVFAILIYITARILATQNFESGARIFDLWYFAFMVICADVAFRIRNTMYVAFPVGYLLLTLYRFLELPYYEFVNLVGALLHLLLGLWFIMKYTRVQRENQEIRTFFLVMAIFSVLFSMQGLLSFPTFQFLEPVFTIQIPSYVLVGMAGKYLIQKSLEPDYIPEAGLMVLVIVIHIAIIIEDVLANFIG